MKTIESAPEPSKLRAVLDFSVRTIWEMRGPLDEDQEWELTLDQCDILRRDGQLRLTDPETSIEYVLVPASDYDRTNGR